MKVEEGKEEEKYFCVGVGYLLWGLSLSFSMIALFLYWKATLQNVPFKMGVVSLWPASQIQPAKPCHLAPESPHRSENLEGSRSSINFSFPATRFPD